MQFSSKSKGVKIRSPDAGLNCHRVSDHFALESDDCLPTYSNS